jgi:hypothetical protein
MPRLVPSRPAAACTPALTLALIAALAVASAAAAGPVRGVPAGLRVVAGQRLLAEARLRTGTTAVPTSAAATCFGAGTGGSGKTIRVSGPTPLGLLAQAARSNRRLRPLLVTDHFSFGLGLCGVGGLAPSGEGFWQLRVNHVAPSVGGDSVHLHAGDQVLWDLASAYPGPGELWLRAPRRARRGRPFEVRVFSYDEAGKRSPAAGVRVSGARRPTGADGRTGAVLRRPGRLIARRPGDIPSNRVAICIGGSCPGRR